MITSQRQALADLANPATLPDPYPVLAGLREASPFAEFDGAIWDDQIESDAGSGKLDPLAAEALAEYHAGKATEI